MGLVATAGKAFSWLADSLDRILKTFSGGAPWAVSQCQIIQWWHLEGLYYYYHHYFKEFPKVTVCNTLCCLIHQGPTIHFSTQITLHIWGKEQGSSDTELGKPQTSRGKWKRRGWAEHAHERTVPAQEHPWLPLQSPRDQAGVCWAGNLSQSL